MGRADKVAGAGHFILGTEKAPCTWNGTGGGYPSGKSAPGDMDGEADRALPPHTHHAVRVYYARLLREKRRRLGGVAVVVPHREPKRPEQDLGHEQVEGRAHVASAELIERCKEITDAICHDGRTKGNNKRRARVEKKRVVLCCRFA